VGVAILKRRPVGEAWDALAAYTVACDAPAELAKMVERMWDLDGGLAILPDGDSDRLAYRRVCAFYGLLRGKPKSVLKLTAAQVRRNPREFRARVGLTRGTELTSEDSGDLVCHTCRTSLP
jgi:hypothetical protein